MADTEADRVDALVKELRRQYPDSVLRCGALADSKGQTDDRVWPDWCWLPMGGVHAYLGSAMDLAKVTALTQWRLGRGVYMPDPEVVEAAVTQLYESGGIEVGHPEQWQQAVLPPLSAWERIPDWCCYVSMPEIGRGIGEPLSALGIFVHLEHDMNNGRPELRLLVDTDGTWDGLVPLPVYLNRPNLGAALGDAEQSVMAAAAGKFGADVRSLTGPGEPGTAAGLFVWQVLPLALTLIDPHARFVDDGSATAAPVRAERGADRWKPAPRTHAWRITYQQRPSLRAVT